MLITVFAGVSYGLERAILAEFRAVPNPHPADDAIEQSAASTPADARTKLQLPLIDDASRAVEIGGPKGPEPTRFGDWERNGRCVDF